MGFKGEGRSDNELNRWILSERKSLLGLWSDTASSGSRRALTSSTCPSLITKKQERAKEVAELDREIEEKQLEVKGLKRRLRKSRKQRKFSATSKNSLTKIRNCNSLSRKA